MSAFIGANNDTMYTIAKDCALFVWEWHDRTGAGGAASSVLAGPAARPSLWDEGGLGSFAGEGGFVEDGVTLHVARGEWKVKQKHFLWGDAGSGSGGGVVAGRKKGSAVVGKGSDGQQVR